MPSLGSKNRPAVIRVRTMEKAELIIELCNEHGWQVIAGIEPQQVENVSDVRKLMRKKRMPLPEFLLPE